MIARMLFLLTMVAGTASASANEAELQRIAAQLSEHAVVLARMHITQNLAVLSKPLESSGHILVDRNLGVVWQVDSPFENTTLYPVDVPEEETGTTRLVARFVSDLISTVMAGQFDQLSGFLGIEAIEMDEQGHFSVHMVPSTEMLAGSVSSLVIEGAEDVERVALVTADGDSTVYRFSDHIPIDSKTSLADYLPLER